MPHLEVEDNAIEHVEIDKDQLTTAVEELKEAFESTEPGQLWGFGLKNIKGASHSIKSIQFSYILGPANKTSLAAKIGHENPKRQKKPKTKNKKGKKQIKAKISCRDLAVKNINKVAKNTETGVTEEKKTSNSELFFTGCTTKNNNVYLLSQCGVIWAKYSAFHPEVMPSQPQNKVVQLDCGKAHVLALTGNQLSLLNGKALLY